MKRNLMILSFFMSVVTGTVSGQDSLDRYLETAASQNPLLRARFNEYQAALQQVPQAGTLPDPKVAFAYLVRPVETRVGPQQARISASQMFPWFGTLDARQEAAAFKAKAAYEKFGEARSHLFFQVRAAYYDLYVTEKTIQATRENLEILQSFLRLTTSRMETGDAPATDRLRTEMEIGDMENQLAELLDRKQYQEVKFRNLLYEEESLEILLPGTLDAPPPLPPKEALTDSLRRRHPALKALDMKQSALQQQERAAKKAGMPAFSLGMEYMVTGMPEDRKSTRLNSSHYS